MRIDKFLSDAGICSRSECRKAARAGHITVDGVIVKAPDLHIDPQTQNVAFMGKRVPYQKFTYLMLNKPEGYLSVTDAPNGHTVLELLDERTRRLGLFPCGRLDKNTSGLLLLTNDGELSHRLLSPKYHVSKVYFFRAERLITREDCQRLEDGVLLDGERTKPAKLTLADDQKSGFLTLTEGKFHQVKRMLEAVCNKVIELERVEFAGIPLDPALPRGAWRELTADEIAQLKSFA